MGGKLTITEHEALDRCEKTIAAGLEAFFDVGRALLEIRDSRLYRVTHATFEEYCRERWDMSRARAYQLIASHGVVMQLQQEMPDAPMPSCESHARTLSRVAPRERPRVWLDTIKAAKLGEPDASAITSKMIASAGNLAINDEPTVPVTRTQSPNNTGQRDELADLAVELLRAIVLPTSEEALAVTRMRTVRILIRLNILDQNLDADLMNAFSPREKLAITGRT